MNQEFPEVCFDPNQAREPTPEDFLCPSCKAEDSMLVQTNIGLRSSTFWFMQCIRCPYYQPDSLENHDFELGSDGDFEAFLTYLRYTTSIGLPYNINAIKNISKN